MENNFIDDSHLLQSAFVFQWIFSMMGINLPPCLAIGWGGSRRKVRLICVWCLFAIHSMLLLGLVLWIVYINNVVVDVVVENNDLDSITSVLSIGINVTVAIVQVTMQSLAFIKRKSIKTMITSIGRLERDILLYYREYQWPDFENKLNFHERCQRFRYSSLWRYGLYVTVFSGLFCYMNYHLIAGIVSWRDKILTLFCTLALQMKAVEFCIAAQIINEFLTSLHDFLKSFKHEMAKSERKSFMGLSPQKKLLANQLLMNRIWILVVNIEEYFAIPLLVLYLYNGITITHTINWWYVSSFFELRWACCGMFRLFYIILTFFNMLMPCWLAQSCIDKYKEIGSTLHNIKTHDDIGLKFRVREYSLQLRHQQMLFTCAGLFDINLRYFGLMMLSISTYVAILIQFKLQKETEKANVRL